MNNFIALKEKLYSISNINSVLAMRGENDGHESDSSECESGEEVQSSGNSSLNLSDEEENLGPH